MEINAEVGYINIIMLLEEKRQLLLKLQGVHQEFDKYKKNTEETISGMQNTIENLNKIIDDDVEKEGGSF